jgi:hypothetical protein
MFGLRFRRQRYRHDQRAHRRREQCPQRLPAADADEFAERTDADGDAERVDARAHRQSHRGAGFDPDPRSVGLRPAGADVGLLRRARAAARQRRPRRHDGPVHVRPGRCTGRRADADLLGDRRESSVSETVTITVTGALPGGQTALSGRILDTNDFVRDITTPIVGATVSIRGTSITSVSDATGRFTLLGMRAGAQVFDIDTSTANPAPDGSPYAGFHQGLDLIEGVVNVIERPFFLPRIALDSITQVDPNAMTTVTNPSLNVSLVIPAGTARAADGLPFDGSLSISEVPAGLAPEALPDGVAPGMLITIQPLGVTFDTPVPISFPNIDHLLPFTEVDLWSLNPETGQFLIVGTGRVSNDGTRIDTISGGVRAADWHFFLPLAGVLEALGNLFSPPSMACPCGSETSVTSGELTEEHVLASYRSFETPRALRFAYGSLRADPQPIISTTMTVPVRAAVPPRISARLNVGGIDQGQPVFTNPAGLNEDRDEAIRQAVQFDASALPTGLYPYTLALTSHYAMSAVDTTIADQIVVHNERDSAFGAGWTLGELQRLYQPSDDELLIVSRRWNQRTLSVAARQVAQARRPSRAPAPQRRPWRARGHRARRRHSCARRQLRLWQPLRVSVRRPRRLPPGDERVVLTCPGAGRQRLGGGAGGGGRQALPDRRCVRQSLDS